MTAGVLGESPEGGAEDDVSRKQVALVIMEAGARWPTDLAELQAHVSRTMVEAQPPEEDAAAFARRVVGRVRSILDSGEHISTVVMAFSENPDPSLTTPRYRVARASVAAMTRHGIGQLVLFANHRAPDALKHQLFSFAGALFDGLRGTRVEVSVRFSGGGTKGGLRPSPSDTLPPMLDAG